MIQSQQYLDVAQARLRTLHQEAHRARSLPAASPPRWLAFLLKSFRHGHPAVQIPAVTQPEV